jgi:hypothetical protein
LQLTVNLRTLTGKIDEKTDAMIVDGTSCPKKELHCQVPNKGTYFWEDKEATCSRTHAPIYQGEATLHTRRGNESTIAMISNDVLESYAGNPLFILCY